MRVSTSDPSGEDEKSGMTGDCHVPFRGSPGVRFPWATRLRLLWVCSSAGRFPDPATAEVCSSMDISLAEENFQ